MSQTENNYKLRKPVTIKDVARLAGTSTTTVSYVLSNEKRYIRPELRNRVQDAAQELGYVKNAVAGSIRGKRKKILAIVVAQFGNTFFTRMCVDIELIARRAGYVVMLCNSDEDLQQEGVILERLVSQRVDGCVISPALSSGKNIALLQQQHIPYVILERPVDGAPEEHNFVGHDNYQSAYLATKHLLDAGHRQIAFSGWDSFIPNVRERVDGYRGALLESGITPDEAMIFTGELSVEAGRAMATCLCKTPATAVVLGHHDTAKGALLYFQDQGIRWPEDISIVMIGTPEWQSVLYPKLTCIQRPEHPMAVKTAAILLQRIKNPELPTEQAVFPSVVIEGLSVLRVC